MLKRSISALFLATAAWPQLAVAQSLPDAAAEQSVPDAAAEQSVLDAAADTPVASTEIVVTARKREELIENVPIAASAFGGEELRAFGVETGLDLTQFTPGVTATNNGSGINNEFIIRGEGATRQNNAETGSGLYRDEMFIPGGNAGGRDFAPLDFFDLARIEVLRGPQGSYFGRNAVGGAVNIVSERPSDRLEGRVEARAGSEKTYGGEAVLNVPIGEAIAVRIGGFGERQDSGFYRSTLTGEVLDRERRWGVRGQVSIRPVTGMSIRFLAEHSEEDAPRPEVFEFVLPVNDPPYNDAIPSGFSVDRFEKPISSTTRFTREIQTYRADLSFDLGPATFKSITGFRRRVARSQQDVDVFAVGAVQRQLDGRLDASETFKRLFQNVRLTSNGDGRIDWLVGAEYTKVDSILPTITNAVVPTTLPAGCTAAIGCTLPVIQNAARNAFRQALSSTDDESYALYAAITVKLTDRLSATADARYTQDDRNFASDELRRLDNPATPVNEQLRTTFTRARTTQRLTPGASVLFKLADAINLYARVATAFRAGGFNNDPGEPNDGVSPIVLPPTYEPELVTGYEVGAKGRIPGFGRYSLSGFYADKRNTLVNYGIFVGCRGTLRAGCAANTVRQVGALRTGGDSYQYGAEAELQGRLFSGPAGRLIYRASVTWTRGEYGSALVYSNGNIDPATSLVATDVGGNQLARLRDWTLTGTLGYALPVAHDFELFANLQGRAELGGFEDVRNITRYDNVVLFNGTIGIGNDNTSLSLRVKNLFQAEYFTISPGNQFFGTQANEPRTFLVRLTQRFGG